MTKTTPTRPTRNRPAIFTPGASIDAQVTEVMAWLKAHSSKATRDGMARYAIPSENALGVAMKDMKAFGKSVGHNQALANALWKTGVYEARILTSFVGDPTTITAAQMDAWCKDFDNWAICDSLCFNLFDRTPHAWKKLGPWSRKKGEFEKRTAFALLWSLALHDRHADDQAFIDALSLIEQAADDERNFVWKAVAMALKAIGKRNAKLRVAAMDLAVRLAASPNPSPQRIGKDAVRELGTKARKG
jgi:3-methyladenine DNA glycosylase AlkD